MKKIGIYLKGEKIAEVKENKEPLSFTSDGFYNGLMLNGTFEDNNGQTWQATFKVIEAKKI
jgi:hypothetical protein